VWVGGFEIVRTSIGEGLMGREGGEALRAMSFMSRFEGFWDIESTELMLRQLCERDETPKH